MSSSPINPRGLLPSFQRADAGLAPTAGTLDARDAFYYLVNVEEHPEILPLAYDVVIDRLGRGAGDTGIGVTNQAGGLDAVLEALQARRREFERPWQQGTPDVTRRQVLHYFLQFMPTAFVDGCWLQCGPRVSTAHTPVGGLITGLYAHQVRAFISDPTRHFVADYRAAYARLGTPLEEVSSRTFAQRPDFAGATFPLPVFLLAIAQYTRTFPAEMLGVNLAWQYLDLSAFGPRLVRDVCAAYQLPPLGQQLDDVNVFPARTRDGP